MHLHAAQQVAPHPVGAADVVQRRAAVEERENAVVLQEATDFSGGATNKVSTHVTHGERWRALHALIETTRTLSLSPGTPGRRRQMPLTTRSTRTPACDASYSFDTSSASSRPFTLTWTGEGRASVRSQGENENARRSSRRRTARRAARLGVRRLRLDHLHKLGAHALGRHQQHAVRRLSVVPGRGGSRRQILEIVPKQSKLRV